MFWSNRAGESGPKKPFGWLAAVAAGAILGIAAGYNIRGTVSIVDGTSMLPNFTPGTRVFTTPVATGLERGDVVMLDDNEGEFALKRIVGLPGETVVLWRGYVFINGRMLVEPYLPKYTFTFPDEKAHRNTFKLGENEYFVLGDNRLQSVDSRAYGPVPRAQIKARVPESSNRLRAGFCDFTLPERGKTGIRPLLAQY